MLLDNSISRQIYIEDCEVCCNPIEIKACFDSGTLLSLDAQSIEQ